MSDIAISVENLSKSYLVGHNAAQAERYTALRDVVSRNARNLARKTRDMLSGRAIVQGDEVEEFWALKDVSFQVKRGEVLGIIGRNGAGKSTLLKILSRITEPTSGRIEIAGRVASLLEVGTGFHPELSGRENIFLNGAILGMPREEILRKFDEIVDFSGVEKFLDTPVKRYSSGMYVRLAFAVAAHLEPEILIIDEVLAVGDAEFQKKCLGKMQEVGGNGKTVLFVSHNLGAIQNLCTRGMLINRGSILFNGDINSVISKYMSHDVELSLSKYWRPNELTAKHGVVLKSVQIHQGRLPGAVLITNQETIFEINLDVINNIENIDFGISITNSLGIEIVHVGMSAHKTRKIFNVGAVTVQYSLPQGFLRAGDYNLSISAMIPNSFFVFEEKEIIKFHVEFSHCGWFPHPDNVWRGLVGPEVGSWNLVDEVGR